MLKKLFSLLIIASLVYALAACEKEKTNGIISEKEGVEYYQKGEYEKALPLLGQAADSGNAAAFYYLGLMKREGNDTAKSEEKSCEHFLKAAEGNYKKAYLKVAECFFAGKEFKQDFSSAFKWGKKAAGVVDEIQMDDKDRLALAIIMGNLYASGKGTLQDFSEAAKWLHQAAEKDYAPAQGMMAFFYYSGQGVLANKEKAKYWAEKAASQGDMMGEFALGMLYQYRDNPDMKEAKSWYEKSAMKNNEVAQYQLGRIYENGTGVKKDLTKAHHYYRLAAKSGKDYPIKALSDFERKHKLENNP